MKCCISGAFILTVSALFAKTKSIFREKKNNIILEILTCDPSVYTMDHPDLNVSNFMEKSIGLKRVERT